MTERPSDPQDVLALHPGTRVFATNGRTPESGSCVFSVCCLMNDLRLYAELRNQLERQGFTSGMCEFLVCDNSRRNEFSGYEGVRLFLREARGKYVLIVHQDAWPLEPAAKLLDLIARVEVADPLWAVLGNAGKTSGGRAVLSLATGEEVFRPEADFCRVGSIDEHMMLVRNGTGVNVSGDLDGYHFYAFDLCSVAARLGYRTYAVDHLWRHDSHGTVDDEFLAERKRLERKMREYHRGRFAPTTSTTLCWSASPLRRARARALSILTISRPQHRAIRRKMWLEGLFTNPLFLFYIVYYRFRDAWCWVLRRSRGRPGGGGQGAGDRGQTG